jgi:phosphoglycolate phosphatase-like HAD superfamily hydrolase
VVASSAAEEELETMLEQVGLDDLIEKKTSSDDADRSKPDPDIIEAALARAKLAPRHAVLLGDTPYDIEAAARAGVDTVALLTGGWAADDLNGAIAIYADPADLLRSFTSSPFSCAWSNPDRSGTTR